MRIFKFKQHIILMEKAIAAFCIVALLCISGKNCVAQDAWKGAQVKGGSSLFNCERWNDRIFIKNSKYKETAQTRKQYDPDNNEYSYVRLTSQLSILEAFRETFDAERISILSKSNESVTMSISVDEKGQLINIRFSLNIDTRIKPSEMEILENQLVSRIRFEVIGKRIFNPIFYDVSLRVYFSEVEKGEIRMAHNLEKLKAPNDSSNTQ